VSTIQSEFGIGPDRFPDLRRVRTGKFQFRMVTLTVELPQLFAEAADKEADE
jgi:hypothetical protein